MTDHYVEQLPYTKETSDDAQTQANDRTAAIAALLSRRRGKRSPNGVATAPSPKAITDEPLYRGENPYPRTGGDE